MRYPDWDNLPPHFAELIAYSRQMEQARSLLGVTDLPEDAALAAAAAETYGGSPPEALFRPAGPTRAEFQDAVNAAAEVGGTVVVDRDYNIGTSGEAITVSGSCTIEGFGLPGQVQPVLSWFGGSHSVGDTDFFITSAGVQVVFKNLHVRGPVSISGGNVHLIRIAGDGSCGYIRDCVFDDYSFAIWLSDNGTSAEIDRCWLNGYDGSRHCTGVLTSGSSGTRRIYVRGCKIANHGHVGSNLAHGLYLDDQLEIAIQNNDFLNLYGNGFYAQIHDGASGGKSHVISGNYFGPQNDDDGNGHGLQTSRFTKAQVERNTFDMRCQAIEIDGEAELRGNVYYGSATDANEFMIVATEDDADILLDGEWFMGASNNPIRIDWNHTKWRITRCQFLGAMEVGVYLHTNLTTTNYVTIEDCDFIGPTVYCIETNAAGHLKVKGNRFHPELGASVACLRLDAGTLSSMQVEHNDFSQGGTVDKSIEKAGGATLATGWSAHENFGTKGFKSENGAASVAAQHNTAIAHGLGNASVSIIPRLAFVRAHVDNRVCYFQTVDATNLTLSLRKLTGATGDTIAVDESITWYAEQ